MLPLRNLKLFGIQQANQRVAMKNEAARGRRRSGCRVYDGINKDKWLQMTNSDSRQLSQLEQIIVHFGVYWLALRSDSSLSHYHQEQRFQHRGQRPGPVVCSQPIRRFAELQSHATLQSHVYTTNGTLLYYYYYPAGERGVQGIFRIKMPNGQSNVFL